MNGQPNTERNTNTNVQRPDTSKLGAGNASDENVENDEANFGEQIDTESDVEINPSKLDTNEVDLDRGGVNYTPGQQKESQDFAGQYDKNLDGSRSQNQGQNISQDKAVKH